jgi:hypothetical protein
MKLVFFSIIFLFCVAGLQAQAVEGGGYVHGNGGDQCENRFKSVRDEVSAWILNGGSKDLRLPVGISHEKYSHDMLEKMQAAKVSCVDKALLVRGAEKTCVNFVAADGSLNIECNRNRFMTTTEPGQNLLVHHEYAGLAGFEVNIGEGSNYEISNQILGGLLRLRIGTVKMTLTFITKVASRPNQTPDDHAKINNSICMFLGRISESEATQDMFRRLDALNMKGTAELKINFKGLLNYCIDDFVKEDPQPIGYDDVPGLLNRVQKIEQQLAEIENYMNQRFAH